MVCHRIADHQHHRCIGSDGGLPGAGLLDQPRSRSLTHLRPRPGGGSTFASAEGVPDPVQRSLKLLPAREATLPPLIGRLAEFLERHLRHEGLRLVVEGTLLLESLHEGVGLFLQGILGGFFWVGLAGRGTILRGRRCCDTGDDEHQDRQYTNPVHDHRSPPCGALPSPKKPPPGSDWNPGAPAE